ncbi:MAG: 23S rRNA (pseudouridine1915-N3)-methyltransferase [Flavobacteriaceae bacterium]|jgi:23S rRNA (pseudouridine1915-N3)-methyltransferase|tara:strand:- start:2540 stop:3013 length:474 start_codon:yes stop_codon:yes gene_type:complete
MEIQLLCIGKTDRSFWIAAVDEYAKRLKHYIKFSILYLPDAKAQKKTNVKEIKDEETKRIIQKIKADDVVYLLDEKGKSFTSVGFSKQIEQHMISGTKRLVFVIGGAYGFSDIIYKKYSKRMCLSKMTFSHQMVRLFFCEQLYRAFTIIKHHPYHNN